MTDGTYSEVVDGDLKEGQEVVVNMLTGLEPVTRPGQPAHRKPADGSAARRPGGGWRRRQPWRWRRPRVLGDS